MAKVMAFARGAGQGDEACIPPESKRPRPVARPLSRTERRSYLILPSLYSTCSRFTGSYFFTTIFSVMVRAFFLVT